MDRNLHLLILRHYGILKRRETVIMAKKKKTPALPAPFPSRDAAGRSQRTLSSQRRAPLDSPAPHLHLSSPAPAPSSTVRTAHSIPSPSPPLPPLLSLWHQHFFLNPNRGFCSWLWWDFQWKREAVLEGAWGEDDLYQLDQGGSCKGACVLLDAFLYLNPNAVSVDFAELSNKWRYPLLLRQVAPGSSCPLWWTKQHLQVQDLLAARYSQSHPGYGGGNSGRAEEAARGRRGYFRRGGGGQGPSVHIPVYRRRPQGSRRPGLHLSRRLRDRHRRPQPWHGWASLSSLNPSLLSFGAPGVGVILGSIRILAGWELTVCA